MEINYEKILKNSGLHCLKAYTKVKTIVDGNINYIKKDNNKFAQEELERIGMF